MFTPAVIFFGVVALKSYRSEARVFQSHRRPVPLPPKASAPPLLQAVQFRSTDGPLLSAWYLPSRNRAGIVLAHGAGGDRSELLPEARALAGAGFGVLLFDWPGHGESEGEVHWSEGERAALRAALRWLTARADVDPGRVGAYGFSMGGYVVAQIAAGDRRLRAVALAAAPPDPAEQTRWEYRRWGFVSQEPALWAVRRGGLPLDRMLPRDLVPAIAPRALLVIVGAEDGVVPPFMARQLFDVAGEPKELLVIPGAGHGDYERAAPGVVPTKLVGFFSRELLGPAE